MQLSHDHIKHLVPINQLLKEHQHTIADQSHILQLGVGDELTANEEHRWFLYLLKGKLDLVDVDRQVMLVSSTDDRAQHPLFNDGERKTSLVAQTSCIVVRFDKQLFHTFVDTELLSSEQLETVEMNETEGLLFNEIMHAFNMGKLKLPGLPEVATKIRAVLTGLNLNVKTLSRIVSMDPVISVRLISASNDSLAKDLEPVVSIEAAIVRLGLKRASQLVAQFASEDGFNSQSELLNSRLHQVYDYSVEVATLSMTIARQRGQLSEGRLYLAGLLYQIGVIPILSYIEDTGLVISDEQELNAIIANLRGAVGSMVIKHFGLPDHLIEVVEEIENWCRDTKRSLDTCDIVIIAQIYNRLKHHEVEGLPKMEVVPALKKVFPEQIDKDFARNVFTQSHEELGLRLKSLGM